MTVTILFAIIGILIILTIIRLWRREKLEEYIAPTHVKKEIIVSEEAKQLAKRNRFLWDRRILMPWNKVWVKPKFDTMPNPNKYWRRFKTASGRVCHKKYYNSEKIFS